MGIFDEIAYDLDFRKPRVTAVENFVILESISEIVMVTDDTVTVRNAQRYVSLSGENFVLKEISEGRMIVEGRIKRIEFL